MRFVFRSIIEKPPVPAAFDLHGTFAAELSFLYVILRQALKVKQFEECDVLYIRRQYKTHPPRPKLQ